MKPDYAAVQNLLRILPSGACRARGWLQRHMQEDAEGWIRVANEMSLQGTWLQPTAPGDLYNTRLGSRAPFYQPYVEHCGALIGGEYQAHWLDIVFRLGWVANLEDCRELAVQAVEAILRAQDADGYLGALPPSDWMQEREGMDAAFELWGQGETLNALMLYHHFTGDPGVLAACRKAADWLINRVGPQRPESPEYQKRQVWDVSFTTALAILYRHTGDRKYLETAEFVFRSFLNDHRDSGDWGLILGEQDPSDTVKGHGAGWGIVLLAGLELYRAGGDASLLRGLRTANDAIIRQHLQPHGALSGQIEYLSGKGPYLDTELCESFWWSWWWTEMTALTGESAFADLAEEAALNAWPASRDKNGRVTAYFHCPNQLVAARYCRYDARKYVECCQSNGPRILPILTERMAFATPEDGLAIAFYGPSETRVRQNNGVVATLIQDTDYPFDEEIRISVSAKPAARFPLLLRIPAWCADAQISVNDDLLEQTWSAGDWARIDRTWGAEERVTLRLPMEARVEFWNQQAVCVKRGPLLYALPVKGERTPLDRWGSFDEVASREAVWNYALLLDPKDPASSFHFVRQEKPANAHVWEHPEVALEVSARRVPAWTFADSGAKIPPFLQKLPPSEASIVSPRLPDCPLEVSGPLEKIRLVPYGFTVLRLTYLPYITE